MNVMAKFGCHGPIYGDDSSVPNRRPGPYPFQQAGPRTAFEVRLMKGGLFARVDMPGVEEGEVEVFVKDKAVVFFKGQAVKEAKMHKYDSPRTYIGSFNLHFVADQTRIIYTVVKHGVLRFVVPAIVMDKDNTCLSNSPPSPLSLTLTQPLPQSSEEDANKNPFHCRGMKGSFEKFVTIEDKMFLRVDMPGVGEDTTDIFFDENKTVVYYRGEAQEEWEVFEGRIYFGNLSLGCECCRFTDVKGNIINGVLRVVVSKINFKNVPCPKCLKV